MEGEKQAMVTEEVEEELEVIHVTVRLKQFEATAHVDVKTLILPSTLTPTLIVVKVLSSILEPHELHHC